MKWFFFECKTWKEVFDLFGEGTDFFADFTDKLKAAEKIYGADSTLASYKKELEELAKEKDEPLGEVGNEWLQAVRRMFPSGADWLEADFSMAASTQKTLPFPDEHKRELRLLALRWKFNYEDLAKRPGRIAFGERVWGLEDRAIAKGKEELIELEKKPEDEEGPIVNEWRLDVKKIFPTGKDWLAQTRLDTDHEVPPGFTPLPWKDTGMVKVKFDSKLHSSLRKILRRFGFGNNPNTNYVTLIKAAGKIYGNQDPDVGPLISAIEEQERSFQGKTLVDWRSAIKQKVPTYEQWIIQSKDKTFRYSLNVGGKSFDDLFDIFGAESIFGDRNSRALGIKIYDLTIDEAHRIEEGLVAKEKLQRDKIKLAEKLKKKIKKKVETPLEWCHLTKVERQNLDIEGKKISDIAVALDMQINPIENDLEFIELGLKIFGSDLAFDEAKAKIQP